MKLSILQLGAGSMGSRRLRDLSMREDVEISLYDSSPARRERAHRRFGIPVHQSLAEALNNKPAAMVISTPPDTHAEYVAVALERKIHFFSEADVWSSSPDGTNGVSEENHIVCAPSSTLKLLPIVKELKRIVNDEIGVLHAYEMCLSVNVPAWHPGEGPEFYARRRSTSGGREMVAFELGYLNYIFGKPTCVSGTVERDSTSTGENESTWNLQLTLEGGGTGHFTVLAGCPQRMRNGWVAGSRGMVRFDIESGDLECRFTGTEEVSRRNLGALEEILEPTYKEEIDLFVNTVLGKGEYYFSYDESALSTAVLAACERSALFGTIEQVDASQQPATYPDSYLPYDLRDSVDAKKNVTGRLYEYAKQRIPGGTQLLSKRPEMFAPGLWPAYFSRAQGCEAWDLDGRHYYDMSYNGIGACLLGFNDPDVTAAVQRRIGWGSMCTLNPPEEVMLADRLLEIHPWAQQARFARTGGEICAIAVRIARATTGRSLVALSGYHGWHDWYLAANLGEEDSLDGQLLPGLEPAGVPSGLRESVFTFKFNQVGEFDRIMDEYGDRLAAIIMEPCRHQLPEPGFLEHIRAESERKGIVLIFDEITIGWRLNFGGSHMKLGVNPDMAVYAKALGNGHPVAAVIGTTQAMEGAHSSFISSTYWTESVGPTAALATLAKMSRNDIPGHVERMGNMIKGYWKTSGERHGLPVIVPDEFGCFARFMFEHELSNEMKTLYTQKMLERGFLAGNMIYPTFAHNEGVLAKYEQAIDEVFGELSLELAQDRIKSSMKGAPAHTGFARLV